MVGNAKIEAILTFQLKPRQLPLFCFGSPLVLPIAWILLRVDGIIADGADDDDDE
jgi:hypothetical protein